MTESKGKIINSEKEGLDVIRYRISTYKGQSGSPIFIRVKVNNGKSQDPSKPKYFYQFIGLHSRRGPMTSLSTLFTKKMNRSFSSSHHSTMTSPRKKKSKKEEKCDTSIEFLTFLLKNNFTKSIDGICDFNIALGIQRQSLYKIMTTARKTVIPTVVNDYSPPSNYMNISFILPFSSFLVTGMFLPSVKLKSLFKICSKVLHIDIFFIALKDGGGNIWSPKYDNDVPIKNIFSDKKEINENTVKYEEGLSKTRVEFTSKLGKLSKKYKEVTSDYFDELEEILIMADVGVNTVMEFMDRLKDRVKKEHITDTDMLKEVIVDELFVIYVEGEILTNKIKFNENGPTVLLFVGVNGVGKTTSIAKLGYLLKKQGKKVLFVAGDTFRAGAKEQLVMWGNRLDVPVVTNESTDPSAVIYDGIKKSLDENFDVVLIDTAGRLQNKVNLMKELEKINKVIGKQIEGAPHETLLVIDATTGQNGISQAEAFKEITNITGIILTKLDGTAKGGIVLAIKESINIPVKYVGLGEKMEDLIPFDIENYIYGLFKDMV